VKDCLNFKRSYVLLNILLSIQVMYKKDNQFWFARKGVLGGGGGGDERFQRSYAVYL
jgi:hypothetical protein